MPRSLGEVANFGGTAAEDDDIKRFFLETETYRHLVDGGKQVVLGRKGSGKTALYLALADMASATNRQVSPLKFSDYPWQAHYLYQNDQVNRAERFVESWRFLILVEVLSKLVQRVDGPHRALGEVKRFLRENYGSLMVDYRSAFRAGGIDLTSLSFSPTIAGSSLGTAQFSPGQSQALGATLGRVNDWLWQRLVLLGKGPTPIYVLFDELDLGFKPDSPDYLDRVIGLLLTIRRLVPKARDANVLLYPIAFLRSDIFEVLTFGDKNKIMQANVEELRWTDRLDGSGSSLKHLIDHRIRLSLDLGEEVADPWHEAFDPQKMVGTQHKFQHMTFRSLLRPRDLIKFCNLALSGYQQHTEADRLENPLISNQDVTSARPEYSEYFMREFDDEIGEAHPGWKSCLDILRDIGKAKFSNLDFDAAYARIDERGNVPIKRADVLPLLYQYSIVGFLRTSLRSTGQDIHFRYVDERINFDPNAKQFAVHRGLKEALDLRAEAMVASPHLVQASDMRSIEHDEGWPLKDLDALQGAEDLTLFDWETE